MPAGHVHVGRWFETEQIALELQGFSWMHGLMQLLDLHAKLSGHSSSEEQPTSTGAAIDNKHNTKDLEFQTF